MERVHSNNIHIIYVRDNRRGQPRMENRETQSALGSRHNTQPRMENRETQSALGSRHNTKTTKNRITHTQKPQHRKLKTISNNQTTETKASRSQRGRLIKGKLYLSSLV